MGVFNIILHIFNTILLIRFYRLKFITILESYYTHFTDFQINEGICIYSL